MSHELFFCSSKRKDKNISQSSRNSVSLLYYEFIDLKYFFDMTNDQIEKMSEILIGVEILSKGKKVIKASFLWYEYKVFFIKGVNCICY